MNRIYLIALLFISSFSFAQSELSFEESGTIYGLGSPDDNFIIVTGYLTNSSSSSMVVTWERDEFDMATGWTSQICDVNLCYLDWIDNESFEIAAGEMLFVKVQFRPFGTPGCSQLKIKISDNANPSVNTDELIYYAKGGDLDCEGFVEPEVTGIDDEVVQSLSLYPNPVMSELNVSMTNIEDASTIEIYNLTGKLVDRIEVDGEVALRIGAYDWNEGMYILSVLDDSDRVLKTQRFSKLK